MGYKSGKLKGLILLKKLLHQGWVSEAWWQLTRTQEGTETIVEFPLFLLDIQNESVYNIGIVNKREIIMNQLTKLQKDYKYFEDMLKRLEKQKKTPGNGFAKIKCREKLAELDAMFDKINFGSMITYD